MEFRFRDKFPGTYFCFDITIARKGLTIELVIAGRSFYFSTFTPSYPHGE